MKAGLTIQEMSKEILRQSQAKTDYLVNTANLRMEPWGNEPMLRVLDANGRDQVEPLTMKQTAHQQLGSYLDIPRKYYDRMLQQEPDLLAHNVNHWFQKQPEQRMIRTIDGHARAFLSNRYRRIDNLDIASYYTDYLKEKQLVMLEKRLAEVVKEAKDAGLSREDFVEMAEALFELGEK